MKRTKSALFASLALAGVLTLGMACADDDGTDGVTIGTPSDASPTATMTAPPANSSTNDRDDFISSIEAQLDLAETQVSALESELDLLSEDLRDDAQARIDDLNDEISEIRSELGDADSASDEEFESMKTDLENRVKTALTEVQELIRTLGI